MVVHHHMRCGDYFNNFFTHQTTFPPLDALMLVNFNEISEVAMAAICAAPVRRYLSFVNSSVGGAAAAVLHSAIANNTIGAKGLVFNGFTYRAQHGRDGLKSAMRANTTLERYQQILLGLLSRGPMVYHYQVISGLHPLIPLRKLVLHDFTEWRDWGGFITWFEKTLTLEKLVFRSSTFDVPSVKALSAALCVNRSLVHLSFRLAWNTGPTFAALVTHAANWTPTLETLVFDNMHRDTWQNVPLPRAGAYLRAHAPHVCVRDVRHDGGLTVGETCPTCDVVSGVYAPRERLYKAKEFKQLLELDPSHPRALFHECKHAPSEDRAQWRADALLIMQSMGRGPYADQIRALPPVVDDGAVLPINA